MEEAEWLAGLANSFLEMCLHGVQMAHVYAIFMSLYFLAPQASSAFYKMAHSERKFYHSMLTTEFNKL